MGCNCQDDTKINNLAQKIRQMKNNLKYKLASKVGSTAVLRLRGEKVVAGTMSQQVMKAYYDAGHSSIVVDTISPPKKDK